MRCYSSIFTSQDIEAQETNARPTPRVFQDKSGKEAKIRLAVRTAEFHEQQKTMVYDFFVLKRWPDGCFKGFKVFEEKLHWKDFEARKRLWQTTQGEEARRVQWNFR